MDYFRKKFTSQIHLFQGTYHAILQKIVSELVTSLSSILQEFLFSGCKFLDNMLLVDILECKYLISSSKLPGWLLNFNALSIFHMAFQNFVIFSSQISINSYNYELPFYYGQISSERRISSCNVYQRQVLIRKRRLF